MIEYFIIYSLGFATPYILKFLVFPWFAKTETWAQIKGYMDMIEKKAKKKWAIDTIQFTKLSKL